MPTTHLKIAKLDNATDIAQSARVVADENEAVIEHEDADTAEMTTAVKKLGYVSTPE